jgi:hypothetical protein
MGRATFLITNSSGHPIGSPTFAPKIRPIAFASPKKEPKQTMETVEAPGVERHTLKTKVASFFKKYFYNGKFLYWTGSWDSFTMVGCFIGPVLGIVLQW